jgi:hypothetical protein
MVRAHRFVIAWRAVAAVLIAASAVVQAGCGPRIDVKQALQVTDVVTGWYDAGIVEGRKNKLVPSVTFRVKNGANETVTHVQFNAVFRVVGDVQELGSKLVRGIDGEGLAAGQFIGPFTLQSDLGYTGEQPRAQLLQHAQFKDAQVEIFAKHASNQWVKLAEFPITRQLLALK